MSKVEITIRLTERKRNALQNVVDFWRRKYFAIEDEWQEYMEMAMNKKDVSSLLYSMYKTHQRKSKTKPKFFIRYGENGKIYIHK
jgi:hypothetical protein